MIATLDVPKELDETAVSVGAALGSRQSAASTCLIGSLGSLDACLTGAWSLVVHVHLIS